VTPALLTTPEYYGTLAAVRRLGRAGVKVAIAGSSSLGIAGFSRYAAERHECPPTRDSQRFIDWLCHYGKDRKAHALCATSDDTAWLFARHRDKLARVFKLGIPPLETIHTLLNKRLLLDRCLALGIDAPRAWFPESIVDVLDLAPHLPYPVIIKPVTQVLFDSRSKGVVVNEPSELLPQFQRFSQHAYAPAITAYDHTVTRPFLQEYFVEAAQGIYNLSGFIDRGGKSVAVRASTKVLQHPRHIGVGLCFEKAPIREDLVAKVTALCRSIDYHGVFEIEFIQTDGRFLLIDFNPRFYNQMAFDMERGLDMALLSYFTALGDDTRVNEVLRSSHEEPRHAPRVHLHRLNFEIMLRAQRASGVLTGSEQDCWRAWYSLHGGRSTDAAYDPLDWWPAALDALRNVYGYLRHPRAFFRTIVMNR
jgi:predicted ATP-grasp superfamily ATP-dependent carboligase